MSLERARLGPGSARPSERTGAAATVAVLLALVGLAATIWRPLAPALGPVTTDLDDFAPQVLRTVEAFREPRYVAGVVRLTLELGIPLLVVWTAWGRRLVARVAGPSAHAPWRGGLVAAAITLVTTLATLPLDVWIGFLHDGEWGFRTSDAGLWARDRAVTLGLSLTVAWLAGTVLVWAVRRWPRSWPWRLVVLGTVLAAVLVLVHPLVIEPLFTERTPLAEGSVRDEIETVLAAAGEPGLPISVADASTRTTRVNAYVTGLGPTRAVVLYDTILELPPEQIAVVVAHELAHREHADLPRGVLLTAPALLVPLLLLRGLWSSPGAARLVDARGPSDPRLVVVAVAFATLASLLGQPIGNLLSRRAEAAADHRAVTLAEDADVLVRTARTFTVRDLSEPEPPGWAVFLWASHPTVGDRIRATVQQARRQDLPLPTVEELREVERAIWHRAIPRGGD
ncbi:MAG: M48 family metalloprotease [Actinobacteria bacterium]|nr:M48 family metalloprotease [Actinomycetota bacterium]